MAELKTLVFVQIKLLEDVWRGAMHIFFSLDPGMGAKFIIVQILFLKLFKWQRKQIKQSKKENNKMLDSIRASQEPGEVQSKQTLHVNFS